MSDGRVGTDRKILAGEAAVLYRSPSQDLQPFELSLPQIVEGLRLHHVGAEAISHPYHIIGIYVIHIDLVGQIQVHLPVTNTSIS